MYLAIALGIALAYALLKPLSDGLFDTSMWVAKIHAPKDAAEDETTKQLVRFGLAALMDGWLSNIPFFASILLISSVVVGFIYSWWGGIVAFIAAVMLGSFSRAFCLRSVGYYLPLLYHKMVNRAVDYRTKGDRERAEAAESYCEDLRGLIAIYTDSQLRPPTPRQLKSIPYGDLHYWLERGADGA